jgi:hypothetical protein
MNDGPPFHHTSDPAGHFFALAFSRGRYVSPSGTTNTPAFLVLYFSNSADFAPFSFMTVSSEGEWLSYHRGEDFLRTVEYALLRALETERIPVGAWTLYPRANVEDHAFPDGPTREAYWESRRRLCMVLYPARVVTSVAAQFGKIEPLFRHDGTARRPDDGDPDNEEIWETVVHAVVHIHSPCERSSAF